MSKKDAARRARQALDARFVLAGPISALDAPHAGWIRAVRDALGMTVVQLGRRMGISGPSVSSIEAAERSGGVRMSTLRRAAEAMDCTLVYALVPTHTLEDIVRARAERVLDEQLRHSSQTMVLEDQAAFLPDAVREDRIRDLIASGRLWTESLGGDER
jgi:predicted DNA-binding mobile mystery protein A